MKLFLIITLIVVIMLIAHSISEQYKEKYDFYSNLKAFLNQFKINVSFKKAKVLDFINEIQAKKQFKFFLEAHKTYLETGKLNLDKITVLDQREKADLKDVVLNLGKYNAENEINQLDSFFLIIDAKLKKAQEEKIHKRTISLGKNLLSTRRLESNVYGKIKKTSYSLGQNAEKIMDNIRAPEPAPPQP